MSGLLDYGKRLDGTKKDVGFRGLLNMTDGSGSTATEQSIGVNVDGREMFIPSIVPTLDKNELNAILSGQGNWPDSIYRKAIDHALERERQGLPMFYDSTIDNRK